MKAAERVRLLKNMPMPMSEDFAVLLGLKRSAFDDGRDSHNEVERRSFLEDYVRSAIMRHSYNDGKAIVSSWNVFKWNINVSKI